jgi:hypothetical protein
MEVNQARLPIALVDFHQAWLADHRDMATIGDDSGGLVCPLERSGVYDIELTVSQILRLLMRLGETSLVQRGIRLSLVATLDIPICLSMADKQQCGETHFQFLSPAPVGW